MRSVAEHFADALADVALSQNAAAEVRRQLGDFQDLLGESAELRLLLDSPAVSRESKHGVVEALVARIGAGRTLRNFLFVVLDRRRVKLLPEIQRAFDAQLDQRQGIARAEITSAHELAESEKEQLRTALERITGRRVEAYYRWDPALIAGAIVRIGSTIYNGSVSAHLERLRARLAAL